MSATLCQCCGTYRENIMERIWYCPGFGLPQGIFEDVLSEQERELFLSTSFKTHCMEPDLDSSKASDDRTPVPGCGLLSITHVHHSSAGFPEQVLGSKSLVRTQGSSPGILHTSGYKLHSVQIPKLPSADMDENSECNPCHVLAGTETLSGGSTRGLNVKGASPL